MKNKIFITLLSLALAVCMLSGCSIFTPHPVANVPEDNSDAIINENCVSDITSKGYITIGCKTDVPELSFYDEKTDLFSGIEVDLAYEIAARVFNTTVDDVKEKGYLNIVGVTVENREQMLENGDIDLMLATYTKTDERAQRFAISNTYYTDKIGLMVKSGKTDNETIGGSEINSISDLDGKYIGVPRNATTRAEFLKHLDTMNTVKVTPIFCEYDSYENLYNALINGNIDVMAVDVSILSGYKTSSTKILSTRFAPQAYGAAAQKENQPLIDIVNEVIASTNK